MQSRIPTREQSSTHNRNAILHCIRQYGPISQAEVLHYTNLSKASVCQIISQLEERGLVRRVGKGASTGGRKPTYLEFYGGGVKLYAFDWTSRVLALMDAGGEILYRQTLLFPPAMTPAAFSDIVHKAMEKIDALGLYGAEELTGICLSLPGITKPQSGVVLNSTELGWKNVDVKAMFSRRFGENVFLESITNCMAIGAGELEAGRRCGHLQLFLLSSGGIGVSSIVCHACQYGENSMYGELGHVKLPIPVRCSCGQSGCIEAVVAQQYRQDGGSITDAVVEYLSIAVSTALNISDAGAAVLVGDYVSEMTTEQKKKLEEAIRSKLISRWDRHLVFRFPEDRQALAFCGLAMLAFRRLFPTET